MTGQSPETISAPPGLDVFAATAGGLPANEPGVDVALALAVASSVLDFSVPRTLTAMGEVGLAGELRAISGLTRRVREAQRLGTRQVRKQASF